MKRRNAFRDRIRVQVVSADIWRSIALLNEKSIPVFGFQQEDDLTYSFQIGRKHFPALQRLLEKRGDRISLLQNTFLHSLQQSVLHRPLFYTGLLLFFLISLWLPTRILWVEVQGNQLIPTRKILEEADQAGITLFSSCAEVRSEKMKNTLLSAIPQLQWAGINTYGCKAVISVRERTAAEKEARNPKEVSSIIAVRDGIVQSVTASRGDIQCRQGQAVKQGQVLISGFTDCGLSIRAERAQGEIYAQTLRSLDILTPSTCQVKTDNQRTERRYAIVLGKKRINLWKDSGIWDSSCGRISREYRLTLPGGFSLPVSLACDTLLWNSTEEKTLEENTVKGQLSDFSRKYLSSQMIAGTISGAEEVVKLQTGCYRLSGRYICSEMIGRERLENGAPYEQSG